MTDPTTPPPAINATEFRARWGHDPTNDDLHRVNCNRAGELGHQMCGLCDRCEMPRRFCGHLAELPELPRAAIQPTALTRRQLFELGITYGFFTDELYVGDVNYCAVEIKIWRRSRKAAPGVEPIDAIESTHTLRRSWTELQRANFHAGEAFEEELARVRARAWRMLCRAIDFK